MAYQHGVYVDEIPTSIIPSVTSDTVPVVFGTASVNLSPREKVAVNEPVLCYTYEEAVEAFGYSEDWNFTLNEFIYSHFALFGASPVVLVNVLDPETHKTSVTGQSATFEGDLVTIEEQRVMLKSVVVKSKDGATTYVEGADYSLDFDDNGNLVIQRIEGGQIEADADIAFDYDKIDPAMVTANDLIGGMDSNGNATGLELLNQVFPRFRIIPGMVLAPGYSDDPTVAAVMTAKAGNINSHFSCMALTDLPTDTLTHYTDAPAWTQNNGYTSERQINGYPLVSLGDKKFHISTQLAGIMCVADAENGGVPIASPSNKNLQADGMVLEDGTEMFLGPDQANYLNGNGIVTAQNFIDGWKAWGNRTGAYPAVTDPKDAFIPVRRMMDWIKNTIILTYWQRVDSSMNKRLIQTVTDSLNLWLNGLTAQGYLLGGRVEFNASDNSVTDLMDGIVRFHVYATPPGPAREIDFMLEYDAQYLSVLAV